MVQRVDRVERVGRGHAGRAGGPQRRQRPAAVGDPDDLRCLAGRRRRARRRCRRPARVRPVPRGQPDRADVDLLEVGRAGRAGARLVRAARRAQQEAARRPHGLGHRDVLRVGDDRRTPARSASRATSPPGRSSTATAPSRFSAATTASALGRVRISTPTGSPGPYPGRDQAAHHVVDPDLRLGVAVGAVLVEEEHLLRPAGRALGDQQAQRQPGLRPGAAEPDQPGQLHQRLGGELLAALDRAAHAADRGGGQVRRGAHRRADRGEHPGVRAGAGVRSFLAGHPDHLRRQLAGGRGRPASRRPRPARCGPSRSGPRPGRSGRRAARPRTPPRAVRRSRSAGPHRAGRCRRSPRRSTGSGWYVGERHRPVADDEAALEHPVVDDELLDEARPAPGPARPPSPRP